MALDHLLADLERDANAEAEALLAAARAEADAIRAEAARLADAQQRDALTAFEDRRRTESELRLARERRAARRRVLEARDRLLDRVFGQASTLLAVAGDSPAYRGTVPERVGALLSAFEPGRAVTVRCGTSLADVVRQAAGSRPGLSVEAHASLAGLVAEADDGAVVADDSLPSRLARARERLAVLVLAELGRAS